MCTEIPKPSDRNQPKPYLPPADALNLRALNLLPRRSKTPEMNRPKSKEHQKPQQKPRNPKPQHVCKPVVISSNNLQKFSCNIAVHSCVYKMFCDSLTTFRPVMRGPLILPGRMWSVLGCCIFSARRSSAWRPRVRLQASGLGPIGHIGFRI